ncbi:MAG: RHS repeat-associated core domain-containing protein [Verrucomicrobiales bacterium]
MTSGYDNLYQLKDVSQSGAGSGQPTAFNYTYDTAGSRKVRKKTVNGVQTTYTHGANSRNQLTGYDMTYDANGNLLTQTDPTNGRRYTYEWDSINRLKAIMVDNDGNGSFATGDTRTEFSYNGFSQRNFVSERGWSGGGWATLISGSYFIWCDGEIAQKRVNTSSYTGVKCNYYDGGETRHTSVSNKTSYYYTRDHLGSVREVTNSSKTVVAAYDYTPYGERTRALTGSGTFNCEMAYTGHFYHPQSGTHLAWFRGHDPRLGRWLNADPIGEDT